jgi:menaquinol-cytochrome c reductase iron-sulfur subunit
MASSDEYIEGLAKLMDEANRENESQQHDAPPQEHGGQEPASVEGQPQEPVNYPHEPEEPMRFASAAREAGDFEPPVETRHFEAVRHEPANVEPPPQEARHFVEAAAAEPAGFAAQHQPTDFVRPTIEPLSIEAAAAVPAPSMPVADPVALEATSATPEPATSAPQTVEIVPQAPVVTAVAAAAPVPEPPAAQEYVSDDDVLIEPPRREFMKKSLAVIIGGSVVAVPVAAGLAVFLDPLRKQGAGNGAAGFLKITSKDALPEDGSPARFRVVADKVDAWSRTAATPIGSVYLKKLGEKVIAFNAECPHLGCTVDAQPDGSFHCPCHNSTFNADGSLKPSSVSPRGMDTLEAQVRDGVVYVKFQNFVIGTHEKVARG